MNVFGILRFPTASGTSGVTDVIQNSHTIAGLPIRTAVIYASLFAVAFCFYSALWSKAPVTQPDSGSYLRAAQDISDYQIDQLQDRAPGYPVLLLLTRSSRSPTRALFFVSQLLHFLSIWLLASALYRAGLKEIMLTVFCLILLLPPYVEPAGYVMSENLAEVMLVSAFVGLVFWWLNKRPISILLSALAIGCAGLTRPTYQVLVLAIVGYVVIVSFTLRWTPAMWKDVVKASLILICGSVVLLGGYAFFNYRNFGYFVITPKLGLTLSLKTMRVTERLPEEYARVREVLIRARDAELVTDPSDTGQMYIWRVTPELMKVTGFQQPELSAYMLRINWLLIKKAPLNYLHEIVWAFGSYWFPASGELANLNSRSILFLWALIHFFLIGGFAFNLILLVGAVMYIRMCTQLLAPANRLPVSERRSLHIQGLMYGLAGTIVFYTAAISCLVEVGDPRYRVPTDGLIVFMLFLGTDLRRRLVDLAKTVSFDPERCRAEAGTVS